jgi:hypothetical protein
MSSTGNALAMRVQIKRLCVQHRVHSEPCTIPLSDPTNHPMILEGYASTDDLDLDRTKMRPYCFGYPLPKSCRAVPLLYKHDPKQVAGKIDDLEYDELGNLQVWCTVTHELAKRCGAFSIRATVNEYEIINGDSPDFYAIIKSATLTEISLTDNPSNPYALVHDRYRVSPAVQVLDLLAEKMKRLQRMTVLIKERITDASTST